MDNQNLEQALEEVQKNSQNPELVKDNKFLFPFNDIWYRVCMPSQKQLAEANQHRNKIKIQMLQKGKKEGFLLKKELISVLKENGIDIEEMDKEIEKTKDAIIQHSLTVAQKSDNEEKAIEVFEKKVKELEKKIKEIINEKMRHLSPAIEYQAEDAWYKSLVASCTEKQESEEVWSRVWKNYSEFENDNSSLPYVAESHFVMLLQNG